MQKYFRTSENLGNLSKCDNKKGIYAFCLLAYLFMYKFMSSEGEFFMNFAKESAYENKK